MPDLSPYNETQLLTLLSQGDTTAFQQLYHHYSGRLFSFAQLYLKDDMIAEDLIQIVFIRCWERRTELSALRSLKDFLFITTRNLVYDHLRKQSVRIKHLDDLRLQSTFYVDESSKLFEKELQELQYKAVRQLPPQQQEVYKRHAEQDQSLDEIAAALNLAKSTVKKHLEVARRSVRTYIMQHSSFVIVLPVLLAGGDVLH